MLFVVLTGFDVSNKYQVKNTLGQQIFFVATGMYVWSHIYIMLVARVVLLYLISKSMHVIGQNRVTRRSINLASALTRRFLPSLIMHVSFDFSKQQLEPLDWHI